MASRTAVTAREQFPPKFFVYKCFKFPKLFAENRWKVKVYKSQTTLELSNEHSQSVPACRIVSQSDFHNVFPQRSSIFFLQTLTNFEASKSGSGAGFLRLTIVRSLVSKADHLPVYQVRKVFSFFCYFSLLIILYYCYLICRISRGAT